MLNTRKHNTLIHYSTLVATHSRLNPDIALFHYYRVNEASSPSKSVHPQEVTNPDVESSQPHTEEIDVEEYYEDVSDQGYYYKSLMKKQLEDNSTYTLPYHTVGSVCDTK